MATLVDGKYLVPDDHDLDPVLDRWIVVEMLSDEYCIAINHEEVECLLYMRDGEGWHQFWGVGDEGGQEADLPRHILDRYVEFYRREGFPKSES